MFSKPERLEIDHHTIKMIVGLIALSLATLTSLFSATEITSISASYHEGGWARNIFVGFLFAIAAFLMAYNGRSRPEMILSKIAGIAAIGIAMFPCGCGGHEEIIKNVHGISAAVMFGILVVFCYFFYKRASDKGHIQARIRAMAYAACGIAILLSILVIALDHLIGGSISLRIPRLVFYGEAVGLIAFGIAWLLASLTLPVITKTGERHSVFS